MPAMETSAAPYPPAAPKPPHHGGKGQNKHCRERSCQLVLDPAEKNEVKPQPFAHHEIVPSPTAPPWAQAETACSCLHKNRAPCQ
jgi:hypothetical protein